MNKKNILELRKLKKSRGQGTKTLSSQWSVVSGSSSLGSSSSSGLSGSNNSRNSNNSNNSNAAKLLILLDKKGLGVAGIFLMIVLISILAIILVPRFFNVSDNAKQETCQTNQANINALVQLYYIKEETWPLSALSNISTNNNYFPESALPECPISSSTNYTLDITTHRVTKHLRTDTASHL